MNDRRDPILLGERLLARRGERRFDRLVPLTLSELYDAPPALDVAEHDADPGPVEKYGDPHAIPSLPEPVDA